MRNKSVAVLDIRSSEICAVVGEKGVNNTFIIKSKYSCSYDGYAEGEIIDKGSFSAAIGDVVKSTLAAHGDRIRTFHVGVPGEFVKVTDCDKVIAFPSPRRITQSHVDSLIALCKPEDDGEYTTVKSSPMYFVLSDKRKLIDPVGAVSDGVRGKISFYRCKQSFVDCLAEAFGGFPKITTLDLIPQYAAQAQYLIDEEERDGYAVLFDLGYISSSYSVICGNGIALAEAFSVGIGHVAYHLSEELDIPFEVAEAFLGKVNLNAKERLASVQEYRYGDKVYSFSTVKLRDIIREGLDLICEVLEECRQSFGVKDLSGKTVYATGEGIKTIRGAAEHISSRLVSPVEIVAPKLPYYDKPQFSSLFSLLAAALCQ